MLTIMMALASNHCCTLSLSVFEFLHIKTKFVIFDVLSTNLSIFAVEGHHSLSDLCRKVIHLISFQS